MKQALQLALIYAFVNLGFVVLASTMAPEFSFSFKALGIIIVISILILILGGRKLLRSIPDIELSYGAAVKYLVVSAFLGTILISLVSNSLYANSDRMKQGSKDYQMSIITEPNSFGMEMSEADKVAYEETMDKMREDIASGKIDLDKQYPYSWSNLPISLGLGLLFALIYCLIAAIFVKVKQVA